MKLNKFFRENARILLIVFMSLLLVVFLLGDVIQWMGRGGQGPNFKVGDAFGTAIHRNDLAPYEQRINVLGGIGLQLPPLGPDPALTYYLLTQEARKLGIHVSREQVLRLLSEGGFSAEMIDRPRRQLNMSLDATYDAIGELLSINMAASAQAVGIGDSEPRLRAAYRDQNQEAVVRLSILHAAVMAKSMPEPTAEALQAHFDEAKDRADAHTETELVFGYRIPDRVQVEYLTIDPEALKGDIRVRDSEVRTFFDQNRARYMKDGPIPASSPTNPNPRPERILMEFDEARERAKDDYRASRAIERAQQLVNEMRAEARRPWLGQPKGADGFATPPPPEKIIAFTDLRDRFASQAPVKYGQTELVDVAGFNSAVAIDGLAASFMMIGSQRVRAGDLAFRVRGLYQPVERDPLPALNLLEPSDVLVQQRSIGGGRAATYKAFIMRVVQVAPAGPPASIDEVRDKLVQNLKLQAAFAEAERRARAIAERTHTRGFDLAVADDPEILHLYTGAATQPDAPAATQPTADVQLATRQLGPFTPEGRFMRRPGGLREVPVSPLLHEQVFALADAPFSSTAPVHRMVVVPVARERKWIVAELIEVKPLYEGEFDAAREDQVQQTASRVQQRLAAAWYNVENVYQRTGFVPAAPVE